MTTLLFVLAATILLSFFITLVESILLGINSSDVERIKSADFKAGTFWQILRKNPYQSITTAVILDTLVLILGTSLASGLFVKTYGTSYLIIFSLLLCIVLIQITEVLPKNIGLRHKLVLAQYSAIPLQIIMRVLRPLGLPFRWFLRPFDSSKNGGEKSVLNDITVLAHAAALNQQISREQELLIQRSLQLSRILASEIMVKREAMNTLSTSMDLNQALIEAHFHNHTRYPLTLSGDIDRIEGYVNFKDIVGALRLNPENPTLSGIVRPMAFVSPSTPLSRLLRVLTRGYQHIAVVRADDGSTLGMVTLEDLLETLVGEMEDEYDSPPDIFVQLAENRFRAGGGTSFSRLRGRIGNSFPDWDVTIDEWLQGLCEGKVPENYEIDFEKAHFKVRRLSRGRVFDVFITLPAEGKRE